MPEQNLATVADELADHLDALSKELASVRRRGRRWIAGLVLLLLAMLATGGFAAADTRAQDRENDRRWCALLDAVTTPVPAGPNTPASARQRKIIAELDRLQEQFHCG